MTTPTTATGATTTAAGIRVTRRTLLSVTALAPLGFATACGASNDAAGDGPVSLTFWHSATGTNATLMDTLVKEFNDAHVGKISVTAAFQGTYDDAMAKLINSVQANKAPDLMQVNDVNTMYMVDSGITVSAAELNAAATAKFDTEQIAPAIRQYYTIDGAMHSMPFQISQPALFVNPDLVRAAGLDPDALPGTVDGLLEAATQIHAKSTVPGLVVFINPWWMEQLTAAEGIIYGTPENGTGKDPVTAITLTDPAQISTWTTLQKMYASKAALNVGTNGDDAQAAFAAGKVAMMFASSAALGNVMKNAQGFTPQLRPMPHTEGTGGAVPGGNSLWVLGAQADGAKEQAAWTFATFLGSADVQDRSFAETGYLPNTGKASGNETPQQKVLLDQFAGTVTNTAVAGAHTGALQQVRTAVGKALEAVLISGADVTATFAAAEKAAADAITSYNHRAKK